MKRWPNLRHDRAPKNRAAGQVYCWQEIIYEKDKLATEIKIF